ncbi:hypothetical protein AB733_23060 [Photobacterium swingsii]|uniref:Resolvase HTH domain-containing protein n=1 Tax=Photobacterium swingsii TaxID=680026 RepID=A0A0J8V5V5_9GAMM|nr:hypothetical protein AB733_23060 [Photobacterium swingsii]PSW24528.1 hypothetical protein C9I94_10860 [Photobacterium swingsii]
MITAFQSDQALKQRLIASRRPASKLISEKHKRIAKQLVNAGYSKKAVCTLYSCTYKDLK